MISDRFIRGRLSSAHALLPDVVYDQPNGESSIQNGNSIYFSFSDIPIHTSFNGKVSKSSSFSMQYGYWLVYLEYMNTMQSSNVRQVKDYPKQSFFLFVCFL